MTALDATGLAWYGELCGRALAKAHARSGDRVAIATYLDVGKAFDKAMERYGLAYADQSQRDYGQFLAAIKLGHLEGSMIF